MFDYDPLDFISYDELNDNEKEDLKKYYELMSEIADII